MPEPVRQDDAVPPEVQDVMRNLVAAIRAVKLYPPNNPIYSQSVAKSYESLTQYLQTAPAFPLGVQKTHFSFQQTPVAKDTQMNKAIAQDLFAKGVREVLILPGVTEAELLSLLEAFALPPDELGLRSGVVSILWEKGASHIKVAEANLDDVIIAKGDDAAVRRSVEERTKASLDPETARKELVIGGRTLVLGDLVNDPLGFAKAMIELARTTAEGKESVEDRLHELYRDACRKIEAEGSEQQEVLYEVLAESLVQMESRYRDPVINGKLYGELDEENAQAAGDALHEFAPNDLHEIMTGRFRKDWTAKQVAVLLRRSTRKPVAKKPGVDPHTVEAEPIGEDVEQLVRDLAEYTPQEMEALRVLGESGLESDIIEASVRTLLFLLPLVHDPRRNASGEEELTIFSGVVQQLENLTSYLLKMKDFRLAMIVLQALRSIPFPAAFEPRAKDALRKISSREVIMSLLTAMRANPKSSAAYEEAYGLLNEFAQEATQILLESLAVEQDRASRFFYLDILKDLGKQQIEVIAEGLTDARWYVVRNVVNILADSGSDQAVAFLEKVIDHKNPVIRQEVIKALTTLGGRRAAVLLTRYLKDREREIQTAALRALTMVSGAGATEAESVMEFLEPRRPTKKQQENEITHEAIRTLGKIGGPEAVLFLRRYEKIRWWRSLRVQEALRTTAREAAAEIEKRKSDGNRAA